MSVMVFLIVALLGFLAYRWLLLIIRSAQLTYIENYRFNAAIGAKVKKRYPHLSVEQVDMVLLALKDYFYICNKANRRVVSMPSQVVDVAWHEFILFTRLYQTFCKKALGRFLHHTPAEAMRSPTVARDGIKRAWRLACQKNRMDPRNATSLPLIFAIDSLLDIDDGFKYSLNCKDKSSPVYGNGYCAGHIGCASGCAGGSGSADSGGDFFDGSNGGSSGCGGGGCGGGGS